jgi:hypothetical protein
MKKFEGTNLLNSLTMTVGRALPLVLALMTSASAWAQSGEPGDVPVEPAPPADSSLTPPPLPLIEPPPPGPAVEPQPVAPDEVPGEPGAQALQPAQVANAPLDPAAGEGGRRALQIGLGLAGGAVAGVGLAAVGAVALPSLTLTPLGRGWTGAALGFAVGVPIGVLVAGWLLKDGGAWWATVLGDLGGLAIAAVATFVGGPQGAPLLFVLPLGGAVLGAQLTSTGPAASVVPVATFGPGSGTIGVIGRW